MSLFKNDFPEHQVRQQFRFWIVGIFMFLFGIFVGNVVVNALDIQTNISNAVQTIRQIFITSDGRQPTPANTLIVLNSDGSGGVKFNPSSFGGGCMGGGLLSINESGVLWCSNSTGSNGNTGNSRNLQLSGGNLILTWNIQLLSLLNSDPNAYLSLDASGNIVLMTWTNNINNFNSNRTTSRIGLPAVNVGAQIGKTTWTTLADFIEGYFFPDTVWNASLNWTETREMAWTWAAYTKNLNWTATKWTNPIASIIFAGTAITSGIPVVANGTTQNGNIWVSVARNIDRTFILTVTDNKGKVTTATSTINWRQRMYRWKLSKTLATLTSSDVIGMAWNTWASTSLDQTIGGNGYVYIALPTSIASPTAKFVMGGFDIAPVISTLSVTNASWFVAGYTIYQVGGYSPDSFRVIMTP